MIPFTPKVQSLQFMDTNRKIIHVDLDSYFASVEQRDHPELRGKPIAVGYDEERGVVSTASYEARRFGVHSAQSIMIAKRLCPSLIIVPPHFEEYKQISRQIHQIFHDYTDLIEPVSIDEAFLDVTHNKLDIPLAVDIARDIKRRIHKETQLTASAGVSYCKFLAKIASDWRKPDGLCTVHPDRALDFIAQLPIEKMWGVGPKTRDRMHWMGIYTGLQLRQCSKAHLVEMFGKAGEVFYDFARGIDDRPVITDWVRKSVGCEHTFEHDISTRADVIIELYHTVLELITRIERTDFTGNTLTLKVKFADFTQITRSITTNHPLHTKSQILPLAKQLMRQADQQSRPIRLLGLSINNPHAGEETHRPEYVEQFLEFEDWPDER